MITLNFEILNKNHFIMVYWNYLMEYFTGANWLTFCLGVLWQTVLSLSENPLFWIFFLKLMLVYLFIKRMKAQGQKFSMAISARKKVAIIIGAAQSVGKEVAFELARRGATVYLADNDNRKGKELRMKIINETKNHSIFFRELNLASLISVRQFVAYFKAVERHVDLLIFASEVVYAPQSYTTDNFELHFAVNHLATFYMTNLLNGSLDRSGQGRIIVRTSDAYKQGKINTSDLNFHKSYNSKTAYCQSKLCNVLFTKFLSQRLEGSRVTVNAVDPEIVLAKKYENFFGRFLMWPFSKTPKNAAQSIIYAALHPKLYYTSGKLIKNCQVCDFEEMDTDEELPNWLWVESDMCTKINK